MWYSTPIRVAQAFWKVKRGVILAKRLSYTILRSRSRGGIHANTFLTLSRATTVLGVYYASFGSLFSGACFAIRRLVTDFSIL
jgi:hypothetical protein